MSYQAKEKKQTLKTQLLSAISMLCIAAVALTGATYAWFTFVANPEITDIDLYVRAAEELYLSPYHHLIMDPGLSNYPTSDPYYDPTLWFATITKDMIATTTLPMMGNNAQDKAFPEKMTDVSSVFTTTSIKTPLPNFPPRQEFFGRVLNALGNPVRYEATDLMTDYGYVQFDLWAKASSDGVVFLDGSALSGLAKSFVPQT